jgi:hypothetical protein
MPMNLVLARGHSVSCIVVGQAFVLLSLVRLSKIRHLITWVGVQTVLSLESFLYRKLIERSNTMPWRYARDDELVDPPEDITHDILELLNEHPELVVILNNEDKTRQWLFFTEDGMACIDQKEYIADWLPQPA